MQQLTLYNTKSARKEPFTPIEDNTVRMYVCGPTVYDLCHIGHARCYVFFDTLYRYLQYCGYHVTYIRNITDIDDKIIQRSKNDGRDWKEIVQEYRQAFQRDLDQLNCLSPTVEPEATAYIEQMHHLIQELVEAGHAYTSGGDVFFSVASYDKYASLSKKNLDDLIAGARVEVDSNKRAPLDFVLWKAAKPGEPSWPSPWGTGRPGWHIECSAMSRAHLGDSIDIHGGGRDLIFPHHENEQAQSECATGQPFARYWVHNGFVNLKSEKMSKSLGNIVTMRHLLSVYPADAIRHFLLSSHYRSPIQYDEQSIKESYSAVARLYTFLHHSGAMPKLPADMPQPVLEAATQFDEAMADDLNTPRALAALFDAARLGNRYLEQDDQEMAALVHSFILDRGALLGLLTESPKQFLQRGYGEKDSSEHASWVQSMIDQRQQARGRKDFDRADEIRRELLDNNIVLEDSKDGTTWRFKS